MRAEKTNRTRYTLLLLLVMSLWGSLYIGNRVLLQYMPVLVLMFFRFGIGSAVLLAVVCVLRLRPIAKEDWPLMAFVGVLGYFLSNALLTLTTALTNASLSSLLNSMNPIFMLLFAYLLLGEPITPKKVFVIALAIAGAAVIIGAPGAGIHPLGVASALGSILLWSLSVILMKRLTRKYHPLTVTATGQAVAGLCSLVAGGVQLAATGETLRFSPVIIGNILYVSVACTAGAHMLWNLCMAHEDSGRCAAFYPVQPMVSMLLGFLLLRERMSASFFAGSAVILASIVLNSLPERPKSE